MHIMLRSLCGWWDMPGYPAEPVESDIRCGGNPDINTGLPGTVLKDLATPKSKTDPACGVTLNVHLPRHSQRSMLQLKGFQSTLLNECLGEWEAHMGRSCNKTLIAAADLLHAGRSPYCATPTPTLQLTQKPPGCIAKTGTFAAQQRWHGVVQPRVLHSRPAHLFCMSLVASASMSRALACAFNPTQP